MGSDNIRAWLEGLAGPVAGQNIALSQGDTMLGRGKTCQVQIPDRRASRRHAAIRFAQGRFYLQDQESTHGTLVNGRPVGATALSDGDTIGIGTATFRFRQIYLPPEREEARRAVPQPIVPSQPPAQPVVVPPYQPAVAAGSQAPGEQSARQFEMAAVRAMATMKSYVGAAFLTWLLYYIGFYIIGLIVNISFLSQAGRIQKETGVSPSGKGCLQLLLLVHFWIPLVVVILAVLTGGAILSGIGAAIGIDLDFLSDLFR